MLLREMFSAIGAPKENEQEIDYLDDLKFFIDNDSKMLDRYFFPAVNRHREHRGNPQVFKVYIRPLQQCMSHYCDQFDIDDADEKLKTACDKMETEWKAKFEKADEAEQEKLMKDIEACMPK